MQQCILCRFGRNGLRDAASISHITQLALRSLTHLCATHANAFAQESSASLSRRLIYIKFACKLYADTRGDALADAPT